MDQSPSWEANRYSVKIFPAFYRTQRFIIAFARAQHLSLTSARSIQSMPPHPISWRSIWILSCFLRISPQKPSMQLSSTHTCYMSRPSHSSWYDGPNNFLWQAQIIKLLITQFFHSHVISVLLGPNVLLSNLFSNTRSLRSSLNVSDHVSHPFKTTGKINSSVYLNLYIFG